MRVARAGRQLFPGRLLRADLLREPPAGGHKGFVVMFGADVAGMSSYVAHTCCAGSPWADSQPGLISTRCGIV